MELVPASASISNLLWSKGPVHCCHLRAKAQAVESVHRSMVTVLINRPATIRISVDFEFVFCNSFYGGHVIVIVVGVFWDVSLGIQC